MRIKRIIALTLALLCFATVAMAEMYVRTVADPTYVRSKPKIAKNIQKELSAGLVLEWGGNVELDDRGIAFLDVYYGNNKYGWVSSLHASLWISETDEYIELPVVIDPENPTNVYIRQNVNVYSGPGRTYSIEGYMEAGDYVKYTGFSKKDSGGHTWYQIKFGSFQGWVPATAAALI